VGKGDEKLKINLLYQVFVVDYPKYLGTTFWKQQAGTIEIAMSEISDTKLGLLLK